MTDPEVRVLVEVTLVAKDGFYSVSKFAPEMWERNRDGALLIAHEDHEAARSVREEEAS